jgi:hypothetical protein
MEVLIGLVLFGLMIYLLPYIIAGIIFISGLFIILIGAFVVLVKKLTGR